MKFIPIFTEPENCDLWSTCYPEDQINEEIKTQVENKSENNNSDNNANTRLPLQEPARNINYSLLALLCLANILIIIFVIYEIIKLIKISLAKKVVIEEPQLLRKKKKL